MLVVLIKGMTEVLQGLPYQGRVSECADKMKRLEQMHLRTGQNAPGPPCTASPAGLSRIRSSGSRCSTRRRSASAAARSRSPGRRPSADQPQTPNSQCVTEQTQAACHRVSRKASWFTSQGGVNS